METTNDLSPSQAEQDRRSPPVHQVRWRLFGIGMVAVWLLVWELSIQYGLGQLYFVPPSVMLRSFYRSLLAGELGGHIWATVARLVTGLVVGAVPAVWFGLRMGRNERARLRYGPFLASLCLIPVIASFPFFIVMFGVGDFQKWAMVACGCLLPYSVLHNQGG